MAHRLALAAMEFFTFFVATVNFRACAKGWWRAALLTDVLISVNGFFLTRAVVEAGGAADVLAYAAGAALGSFAGMRLTRRWVEADPGPRA
jgi:hypothetical protein